MSHGDALYFNLCDGERYQTDTLGLSLVSLDRVREQLVAAVRSILATEDRSPDDDHRAVEVVDDRGRLILVVQFRDAYLLN